MIDMSKTYKTRGGQPVRILCTDGPGVSFPVIGFAGDDLSSWTEQGKFTVRIEDYDNHMDLVEVSPYEGWEMDKPIWVRDEPDQLWVAAHFAGIQSGRYPVHVWDRGMTSHTALEDGENPLASVNTTGWKEATDVKPDPSEIRTI